MKKKQFLVIGLGRFGESVAKTLYELGNDVLAIDSDGTVIQEISDHVTHAAQVEVIDENNLKALGVGNFDVAIIAMGTDVQASIMATILVKELGVKYIIAKASNDLHAKVLYKIGADRVVFPERDMGVRVAHNLRSSNILDFIELSPDYTIAEMVSLDEWHGKTLKQLNVRAVYGVNIVAIKRNDVVVNVSPAADDVIEPGDVIVAIGAADALSHLESLVTK